MPGALDGIRILDLTAMITGPLATMMLADRGAEVTQVEPPGIGDVMRYLGTRRAGMSALFAACNRNEHSIVVDLQQDAGREPVRELPRETGVFVRSFRPGKPRADGVVA